MRRIAGTRGEVDTIVSHIAGTYPPSMKECWGAVAKALALAAGGAAIAFVLRPDDPSAGWPWLLLIAGGSAVLGLLTLLEDTATWSVSTSSFNRRNILPIGN